MDVQVTTERLIREDTREMLREAGLRVTPPRFEIFLYFRREEGHFSADDIHQSLSAEQCEFPRASIYNALHDLVSAGLLRQAETGPGTVLFELAEEPHHHFICDDCRRVFDVSTQAASFDSRNVAELGDFQIDAMQLVLRGLCPACRHQ